MDYKGNSSQQQKLYLIKESWLPRDVTRIQNVLRVPQFLCLPLPTSGMRRDLNHFILHSLLYFVFELIKWLVVLRRGVTAEVPDFLPLRLGFDSCRVQKFSFLSWDWVYVLCVLSCVVSGGDPDILLTTHSGRAALVFLSNVLVQNLLLPLQSSDPWTFGM